MRVLMLMAAAATGADGLARSTRSAVSPRSRAASVRAPTSDRGVRSLPSTREVAIPLASTLLATGGSGSPALTRLVTVLEVDDFDWWAAQQDGDNPYGAKVWPGAAAAAVKLLDLAAEGYFLAKCDCRNSDDGRRLRKTSTSGSEPSGVVVLELGAGSGLCSLVAATLPGVREVVATDLSVVCLELIRRAARIHEGRGETAAPVGSAAPLRAGLRVEAFDVAAPAPLPPADLVVVADMLYDDALAVAVAKRVCEAVARGSDVVIGSDPLRAARAAFLEALEAGGLPQGLGDSRFRFEPSYALPPVPGLGWKAKRIEVAFVRGAIQGAG